jgi:hypothetical protein
MLKALIAFALVLSSVSYASASSCTLWIPDAQTTFTPQELEVFQSRGYSVTTDPNDMFRGTRPVISSSACDTSWIFFKTCQYQIQLGRFMGNSEVFDFPVTGSTMAKAIAKLPYCQ